MSSVETKERTNMTTEGELEMGKKKNYESPTLSGPTPATPEAAAVEQQRRLELAALNRELAVKRCLACTTVGMWTVNSVEPTGGRVRYVNCKACGHPDRVAVIEHVTGAADPAGPAVA
jgi:Zn ribbon nucleic-acid-binding protein